MALGIVLLFGALTNILLKGINAGSIILLVLSLIPAGYGVISEINRRKNAANPSGAFITVILSLSVVVAFGLVCKLNSSSPEYTRSTIINNSISQINKGNYKDAEKELKKLYETDKSPLIASNLAAVYLRLHDTQNARAMLDAANTALYADEKQWFNYGTCFLQMKDYRSALSSFEKTIELNPGLVMAHLYAGTAALNLRDLKRAQYHLEEAAFLNPVKPDIQYYLGRVYTETMDYKRAEECFKKAQAIKDLPEEISNMLKLRLNELKPYLGGEDNG